MTHAGSSLPVPDDLARAMLEQAADAVIYADRAGLIRLWNRGAEAVFGHAAKDVMGQSLDVIIPERFRHAHWEGFHKALASGEARLAGRAMTTRSMHKDGRKLYVELSFSIIRDASGAAVGSLAIGRDCTERHLAAAVARQAADPGAVDAVDAADAGGAA